MQDHPSKKQNLGLWYANVAFSTIFTYLIMHLIATDSITPLLVTSEYQFLACISCFIMTHDTLKNILQLNNQQPSKNSGIIKCLQNIVGNTTLYSIIIISLMTQDTSSVIPPRQRLLLLQLFLWGRIIFSLGYLFGTFINLQSLRSYGFGLCIGSLVTLFLAYFDYNFIAKFI